MSEFIVRALLVAAGYAATLILSTWVVRLCFRYVDPQIPGKLSGKIVDTGFLIGKCENLLAITLVLAEAYVALGLIFTAKTIVRLRKMEEFPEYYLTGTLVNFTFSILMGFLLKLLLSAL